MPRRFFKEKNMTARNKYIVSHSMAYIQSTAGVEKTREVYADQVTMTPTGAVVFHQVRESALVRDNGERAMMKDMAIVLVLKAECFDSIHLAAPGTTAEAYKESGQIELAH